MKFSWDYQQKLQYAGIVALISIGLMFLAPGLVMMLSIPFLILLIYALVFLQPAMGPVKPWQSRGLIMLTIFANMFGKSLIIGLITGDILNLLFAGLAGFFVWQSAQQDPVDIEM